MTLRYPLALLSTPPGLPESGTVGTRWSWAGSLQHHQKAVLRRFPDARPQYLEAGRITRWISDGRIVGEVKPDPERPSEWVGWWREPGEEVIPAG